MVLRPMLYRHWLDLRFMVVASLAPWIGLCGLTALVVVAVSPDTSPVAVHAWALSVGVVAAGLAFGGTGVRPGLEINHKSAYYMLTLPISRLMIGWTRLCAGAGIASVFVFGIFVAVVAALWLAGRDVPLIPMAVSMLLGLAVTVSVQATIGLVLPLVTERFSPALTTLIPLSVILEVGRTLNDRSTGWMQVVRFLEFEPARWDILGLLLLSVPAALVAAVVLMRIREF